MKKRVLAIFLVLFMVWTALPFSIIAEEADLSSGTGEEFYDGEALIEKEKQEDSEKNSLAKEMEKREKEAEESDQTTEEKSSEDLEEKKEKTGAEDKTEEESFKTESSVMNFEKTGFELMGAEEAVHIGSIYIVTADADKIQALFDSKGPDIAEVTEEFSGEGSRIRIKLLKDIIGMIVICISDQHFVLDANGKTLSGGYENEAIQIANGYSDTILELVGNGIYLPGVNNLFFISSFNELQIKSGTFTGNLYASSFYVTFMTEEDASYYTIKQYGINVVEETEKQSLFDLSSFYWDGGEIVVTQHKEDYYINLSPKNYWGAKSLRSDPMETTFTIKNKGKKDLENLKIELSGESAFILSDSMINLRQHD